MLPTVAPTPGYLTQDTGHRIGGQEDQLLTRVNLTGEGYPPVTVTASSLVWVILFSAIILASLAVNTVFITAVILSKRRSTAHLLLILFFLVNLLDYGLLITQFSLGPSLTFPYSDTTCSLYQLLTQASPLLTAGLLLLLLLSLSPPSSSKPRGNLHLPLYLTITAAIVFLLSLPCLLLSHVSPSPLPQCSLSLSALTSMSGLPPQLPTALYYLVFRALLPHWLPLALTLPTLLLTRSPSSPGKAGLPHTLSLPLVIIVSHAVFLLPLILTLTARYILAASLVPLSPKTAWTLDVLESLSLLVSLFLHVFRPLAALVLEPELRLGLHCHPGTLYSPVLPGGEAREARDLTLRAHSLQGP